MTYTITHNYEANLNRDTHAVRESRSGSGSLLNYRIL